MSGLRVPNWWEQVAMNMLVSYMGCRVPKMSPRTKNLNIKYHHFKEEVKKGTVSICHINKGEQMADMLTKPFSKALFESHR
jgi:hypothetical protein